jgi:hypothetical protein
MESPDVSWRKSTFSSSGGDNCVEAGSRNGTVMVRDTKDHGRGQVHAFSADEWRAFVVGIKAGTRTAR